MASSMSVEEAAIIAGSVWMGLFITSYYYDPLTRTRARNIFERVLLQLAGLDGKQTAPGKRLRQDRESITSSPPARRRIIKPAVET